MRHMWLYVFRIHRLFDGKAFLYAYDKITAKKSPNEVVSMLNNFITKHVSEIKTHHLFSDACSGQNRNNTIVQYSYPLIASGIFDHIQHTFPTRGHSYVASDRDFAQIELTKRKQDVVYTPHDWIKITKRSLSNSVVTECEHNMFKQYNVCFDPHFKLSTRSQVTRGKMESDKL